MSLPASTSCRPTNFALITANKIHVIISLTKVSVVFFMFLDLGPARTECGSVSHNTLGLQNLHVRRAHKTFTGTNQREECALPIPQPTGRSQSAIFEKLNSLLCLQASFCSPNFVWIDMLTWKLLWATSLFFFFLIEFWRVSFKIREGKQNCK